MKIGYPGGAAPSSIFYELNILHYVDHIILTLLMANLYCIYALFVNFMAFHSVRIPITATKWVVHITQNKNVKRSLSRAQNHMPVKN